MVVVSGFSPWEFAAWLVSRKLLVVATWEMAGVWASGFPVAEAPWVLLPLLEEPKLFWPETEAPCCVPPPLDDACPPPNCELKVPRLALAWLAAFCPLNWSPPDDALPLPEEEELPEPVVEAAPPPETPAEPLPEADPPFTVLAWPPETVLPLP